MAGRIILGTANPSLDANGAPVSGSTLTFYRNGTTTLQSVFSAIDLMTPLANPLTCDASGEFPQIWATDSLAYSVKWSRPGLADVTYNDIYPMSIANSNYFRFVDVVATSNIAVASGLANGNTIDGQLISTGMRILLTGQSTGAENGIYDAPVSGAASRSADSNSTSSIPNGTLIVVQRGSTLKDSIWLHTTAVGFILGTTALTFQALAGVTLTGTFTPTDASGASLTFSTALGRYTKIGTTVFVSLKVVYPTTVDGSNTKIGGLPFTASNSIAADMDGLSCRFTNSGRGDTCLIARNTTTAAFFGLSGSAVPNSTYSTYTFVWSGSYQATT